MSFGPAPTAFGLLTVNVRPEENGVRVSWKGEWRSKPGCIIVKPAGFRNATLTETGDGEVFFPAVTEVAEKAEEIVPT
jgi:hypothetical protein